MLIPILYLGFIFIIIFLILFFCITNVKKHTKNVNHNNQRAHFKISVSKHCFVEFDYESNTNDTINWFILLDFT